MHPYILAQLNIATLSFPLDSPELKDFVDNLDLVNSLAEKSEGFIWRLQTDEGNATAIDAFGPDTIINMSTWRDVDTLKRFVYKTIHSQFIARRREWFKEIDPHMVLWWITAGTQPTIEEAVQKLSLLATQGPCKMAFDLHHPYAAPS